MRFAQRQRDLKPDARRAVLGQRECALEDRRLVPPCFGQPHRVLANRRRRIAQGREQIVLVERLQPGQRPHRVQPGDVDFAGPQEFSQRLDGRAVHSLEEQSMGRVAPPSVGTFQFPHEFGGRGIAQPGRWWWLESPRREPVDSPPVASAFQVDQRLDVVGDRPGMLDRLAVHVQHVQRAVGRIDVVDRAEPVIGRSDEVRALVGPPGNEGDSVGGERLPMHEVAGHFAHKHVAAKLVRIGVAPVHRHAAGRGEIAVGRGLAARVLRATFDGPTFGAHRAPRFGGAGAVDRQRVAGQGRVVDRGGHRQEPIASQIPPREHHVLHRIADVANEAVAPIVERIAESGATREQLERFVARIETKVLPRERQRLGVELVRATNRAAIARAGGVNAMIQPPFQVVHHRLHVELAKSGEHLAAHVGAPIAVGVLQVPHVGRRRHEDAALPNRHAGRPREPFGEHRAAVELAIAVGVLEQSHAAQRLIGRTLDKRPVGRLVGVGIVVHFDDVRPAVLVIGHRHRIGHQRFGGDQLHPKAVQHAKRVRRIGRFGRRHAGQGRGRIGRGSLNGGRLLRTIGRVPAGCPAHEHVQFVVGKCSRPYGGFFEFAGHRPHDFPTVGLGADQDRLVVLHQRAAGVEARHHVAVAEQLHAPAVVATDQIVPRRGVDFRNGERSLIEPVLRANLEPDVGPWRSGQVGAKQVEVQRIVAATFGKQRARPITLGHARPQVDRDLLARRVPGRAAVEISAFEPRNLRSVAS